MKTFWDEKEIKQLKSLLEKPIRVREIAKILNRSTASIRVKCFRLNLKRDKEIRKTFYTKAKYYCIDCGKEKSKKKCKRCISCSAKAKNWDKIFTKERNEKVALSKLGEKNPMWKGDKVGCASLHAWIKRHKPKPKFCEICKKNKPYDLANISEKYKRDINDFEWICRNCHMKKDGRLKKLHNNNKKISKEEKKRRKKEYYIKNRDKRFIQMRKYSKEHYKPIEVKRGNKK